MKIHILIRAGDVMRIKVVKIALFMLSLFWIIGSIAMLVEGNISTVDAIIVILFGVAMSYMGLKAKGNDNQILELIAIPLLLLIVIMIGLIIAEVIVIFCIGDLNADSLYSVWRGILFISVTGILILYKDVDVKILYTIFAIVYGLCTVKGLIGGNYLIQMMGNFKISSDVINELVFISNNMVTPIKESMLIYIIIDVVFKSKIIPPTNQTGI